MKSANILISKLITISALFCEDETASGNIVKFSPEGNAELTYTLKRENGVYVKSGIMVIFYSTGSVESIQTLVNDELNGMRWDYSLDGKLLASGLYRDGIPVGIWRILKNDGNYLEKNMDDDKFSATSSTLNTTSSTQGLLNHPSPP